MGRRDCRRGEALIVSLLVGSMVGLWWWPMTRVAASPPRSTAVPPPSGAESAHPIVDSSCHSRSDCGPTIRGGLRITYTGWACTTGFVARDRTTGTAYVLTAGHCVAASGLTAQWSHHDAPIGRATLQGLREGSGADVGAIEIDPSAMTDQLVGSDVSDIRDVTGIAPSSSQTVGSVVCRSGATSGWGCGHIIAADVPGQINGIPIRHGWWIDIPSASGDSGAPVVDSHGRAAGILIATTETASLYSTVDGVTGELGLTPCVTPRCD
jgi:hypothetical protein